MIIRISRKMMAAACLLLAMCAFSFTVYAEPYENCMSGTFGPSGHGWGQAPDGTWRYFDHGQTIRGWAEIGDHWYYFDRNGTMLTGWQEIDGESYYLAEASVPGWPQGSCYINCQAPDGTWLGPTGSRSGAQGAIPVDPMTRPNPYGHTCVEIDLTNQCIYVYQQDAMVLYSPCVTGMKGQHDTAAGNFHIDSKETDRFLTGYYPDGSIRYKSWVSYWMPFNGGQGLHDADWRGTSHANFGGTIYMYDGSHGCVNLPHDVAQALFGIAYVGMPVHSHY